MLWKQKNWIYQYGMENHSDPLSSLNIDSNKFPLDTQALLNNLSEMSISHIHPISRSHSDIHVNIYEALQYNEHTLPMKICSAHTHTHTHSQIPTFMNRPARRNSLYLTDRL